jgi:hypothetical protein
MADLAATKQERQNVVHNQLHERLVIPWVVVALQVWHSDNACQRRPISGQGPRAQSSMQWHVLSCDRNNSKGSGQMS